MGWQVTSVIHGGRRYSSAAFEEYRAAARALHDASSDWRAVSNAWSTAALRLTQQRFSVPLCATLASGSPSTAMPGHATLPYARLVERCTDHANRCRLIADELSGMALLLIRAHSLYAESESWATRLLNELLQGISSSQPKFSAAGGAALAGGGMLAGSLHEGRFNPIWGLTSSAKTHEGLMSGLGAFVGGINPIGGIGRTDEVNVAAGRIARVTKPWKDLRQGDMLDVQEVSSRAPVVGASSSVSQALENLRRLAEERLGTIELNSGLDYATIAIQKYRRADDSVGWLVTIPGTDGEDDSPFGWAQNVELMSDDPEQRMNADSARMVVEAMRQAGIGSDEPVALIGHSQGGIVAAAIAADMADQYTIEHVVTAGSPVANHPIPSKTWVTSIEMEDELVAALDGAANPTTENWLTVHGYATKTANGITTGTVDDDVACMPGTASSSWSRDYAGAEVKDAPDDKEITHWLKYHQAAYRNASDLGSPAVDAHERHFQQVIDGELEETRYYRGRMMHGGITTAPSPHRIDTDTLADD
ncbi:MULTISPECIES: alpha/beta fold hydrolase [Bifidobacterium]|uniref:alpha/beta fold hydrolase n=1 Tax=Bifidobacterium TaxID=1678 RepID=UPI001BDD17B4|nr:MULTISPECIES: alpha/beta hydrolase [Bifidobacterium]MBT1161061.1 alpha/beta hydrolase [Bifidobacterium sp. SO1]MBW3078137.1 alpha/beta hydrolase [Bifidobacterium simiiventris]